MAPKSKYHFDADQQTRPSLAREAMKFDPTPEEKFEALDELVQAAITQGLPKAVIICVRELGRVALFQYRANSRLKAWKEIRDLLGWGKRSGAGITKTQPSGAEKKQDEREVDAIKGRLESHAKSDSGRDSGTPQGNGGLERPDGGTQAT